MDKRTVTLTIAPMLRILTAIRFAQLSDQQLHKLALQVDELAVGGDGLGRVIALLVIAILVVLLIQLTGRRVVVTK